MKIRILLLLKMMFLFALTDSYGVISIDLEQRRVIDSANFYIETADSLVKKEMYNSAIVLLNKVCGDLSRCYDKYQQDTLAQLLMEAQYRIGFASYHVGNHENAISSMYSVVGNEHVSAYNKMRAYVGIGNVFIARHRVVSAEEAFGEALKIHKESGFDDKTLIAIYNNLSNACMLKNNYDSALMYLHDAQSICVRNNLPEIELELTKNFGNNYQLRGDYNLAESYYNRAMEMSVAMDNNYSICEVSINLGNLHFKQGRYKEALHCFNRALDIAEAIDAKRLKSMVFGHLLKYYEMTGDCEKALYYSKQYKLLSDSVFNIQTEDKIIKIKSDFELYQIETNKNILEKDLAIAKDKVYKRNVNIVIISILALLIAFYASYLIRRLMLQRRINRVLNSRLTNLQTIRDNETEELMNRFKSDIELKNNALMTDALLLVKTEQIANELLDKIKLLKMHVNVKGKDEMMFRELESTVKELFLGKGWDEFRYCFEQVNSSFYDNLDEKFPGLTPSDRRFAALLSLNLTTKEIAILTNRTVRGVETSKFRLKKKMRLEQDDNLVDVLLSLK